MPGPDIQRFTVTTMEEYGAALQPFVQKMANRLAIGTHRYGARGQEGYNGELSERTGTIDAVATAQLRIETYLLTKDPEHLIDAANFIAIAHRFAPAVEESEMHSGDHSPGRVRDTGEIVGARGRFAGYNGLKFVDRSAVVNPEGC